MEKIVFTVEFEKPQKNQRIWKNLKKPKVFMKKPYPKVGSKNLTFWEKTQGVATLNVTLLSARCVQSNVCVVSQL